MLAEEFTVEFTYDHYVRCRSDTIFIVPMPSFSQNFASNDTTYFAHCETWGGLNDRIQIAPSKHGFESNLEPRTSNSADMETRKRFETSYALQG